MHNQDANHNFNKKKLPYGLILVISILLVAIANYVGLINPRAYTVGAILLSIIIPITSYSIILGIIALTISLIRKNIRLYWFSIFVWLFLFAGIVDIATQGYLAFVLRPKIYKTMSEYESSEKAVQPALFKRKVPFDFMEEKESSHFDLLLHKNDERSQSER